MNQEKYFNDYNFRPIIDKIMKEFKIDGMNPHYSRHFQELKNLSEQMRNSYKTKPYFEDLPTLNDDFSSYVILINTPFVEKAKRDKFKLYLEKKITTKFKEMIKEYIFPYEDEDKEKMDSTGIVLMEFYSNEQAKSAAKAMNGVQIDKTHKAVASAYLDYDKIICMEDKYQKPNYISFLKESLWEHSSLEEMLLLKSEEKNSVSKIHFLKKELHENYSISSQNINQINWSPQGKYLIVTYNNKIEFYGGENSTPILSIDIYSKDYSISNDEKYIIIFVGYSNDNDSTNKENVFIRDINNNELIRGITISKEENFKNFQWSHDSQFFGRIKRDILIVHEAPKMAIILDPKEKKRVPIRDGIKKFSWFPTKNIIAAVQEIYKGNKIGESIIHFIKIPSRKIFAPSAFSDQEILSLEWHENHQILAVFTKGVSKNNYYVRLFKFDYDKTIYTSGHSILPSDSNYYTMDVKWMGDLLFVTPKFKETNLDTINIFPYTYDKQNLKIIPWPLEKCLKHLKHSHFIPSSNGVDFLLACLDVNNKNSYGKVDLYAVFDNKINFCKNLDFGASVENIKWDQGGRLISIENTKKKECEGLKILDSEGNLVYDHKDKLLNGIAWRPRHIPLVDKNIEYPDITKNLKEISKLYDEEDSEFLSEIDKIKRSEEKRRKEKLMDIIKKRQNIYNSNVKEIKKEEEKKIAYEFWIEEILKSDEVLESSEDF